MSKADPAEAADATAKEAEKYAKPASSPQHWIEVARAMVQLGQYTQAINVLRSKTMALVLTRSDDAEDTIVSMLLLAIIAGFRARKLTESKGFLKLLRRYVLRAYSSGKRPSVDVDLVNHLARAADLKFAKTDVSGGEYMEHGRPCLLYEVYQTNVLEQDDTADWRVSNKVEFVARLGKSDALAIFLPKSKLFRVGDLLDDRGPREALLAEATKELGEPTPCWFLKRGGVDKGAGVAPVFRADADTLRETLRFVFGEGAETPDPEEIVLLQQCPTRLALWRERKFHLRLFVLRSASSRGRRSHAWLYRDAVLYASSKPYDTSTTTNGRRRVHLTNLSQQALTPSDKTQACASEVLKNWPKIFLELEAMVQRLMLAIARSRRSSATTTRVEDEENGRDGAVDRRLLVTDTELLGLDVLLRRRSEGSDALSPVLLEINQLPNIGVGRQTARVRRHVVDPMVRSTLGTLLKEDKRDRLSPSAKWVRVCD